MTDLSQKAVMNVDAGEEIVGGWATPRIPQVGVYKLLAKKKRDGAVEWAHFIQRDDGRRDAVIRGTVESEDRLKEVLAMMNKHLARTFGEHITLRTAIMETRTLDGRKISDTKH